MTLSLISDRRALDLAVSRLERDIGGVDVADDAGPLDQESGQPRIGAGEIAVRVNDVKPLVVEHPGQGANPRRVVIGCEPQDLHRRALKDHLIRDGPAPGQAPDVNVVLCRIEAQRQRLDDPFDPPHFQVLHDVENFFPSFRLCHVPAR